MAIRVLVVDDSSFFRRRVSEMLNQDDNIDVVDTANNGQEALEKAQALKPDVITMDIEMPVMNGIDAVKHIMSSCPTAILMFSSLTHDGAQATLDALEAGAADFLPKKFEDIARNKDEAALLLRQRVNELGKRPRRIMRPTIRPSARLNQRERPLASERVRPTVASSLGSSANASSATVSSVKPLTLSSSSKYKCLAIGTSTGGPVALQTILTALPENFPYPIVLIQHMPAAFTPAFAARLDSLCKIQVKEGSNGELLKPGVAYLAPGGKQMLIDGTSNAAKIRIMDDESERLTYRPSVDVTFGTAAKVFHGSVLSVILTGMGADGREGARLLKSRGATVWAQDEATCVVYGMPQAVTVAGLADDSISLGRMAERIMQEVGYG